MVGRRSDRGYNHGPLDLNISEVSQTQGTGCKYPDAITEHNFKVMGSRVHLSFIMILRVQGFIKPP